MLGGALARLRAAERSGSLYYKLGLASAVGAAAFWASLESDRAFRREIDLSSREYAQVAAAKELERKPSSGAPLWDGVLTHSQRGLDGPAMLRGARSGDIVQVLKEDVGPGGGYVECRNAATGEHGWYLRRWVQPAEASTA